MEKRSYDIETLPYHCKKIAQQVGMPPVAQSALFFNLLGFKEIVDEFQIEFIAPVLRSRAIEFLLRGLCEL